MKEQFIKAACELSFAEADFFSGNRKILCNRSLTFEGPLLDDFDIADCGFTKSKLTMLRRLYLVQESIDAARKLWEERKKKSKYGSVSFHCFGHTIKSEKTSKRGSKMGPCLQSVVLTWIPGRQRQSDGWTDITVSYRTTEFFKKFPADLIFLRDELLSQFDFTDVPIRNIHFHFAGMTIHPMYFVTLVPHIPKPIKMLNQLRDEDPHFWDWIVKWTSRYICEEYEHGIQKFEQAKRVGLDAHRRIDPKTLERLQRYVRKHHSGFRGART